MNTLSRRIFLGLVSAVMIYLGFVAGLKIYSPSFRGGDLKPATKNMQGSIFAPSSSSSTGATFALPQQSATQGPFSISTAFPHIPILSAGHGKPDLTKTASFWSNVAPDIPVQYGEKEEPDDHAVQVSFKMTKPEYMVGEPVECVCLIENKSEKEQFNAMIGGGPPNSIQMEVIESPKGTKLRRAYTSVSGASVPELLKPGEVSRDSFLLNPFVWFTKPGTYKLRIKLSVYHADNREMKKGTYHHADQTLSLRCRRIDGAESHAMMTALVKQAIAGEGDWRYAVHKLSVIGMPHSAGYIRDCLRATDRLVRERMIFQCAGDLLEGLRDIGGRGAKQALEEVIEDAKLNEDGWRSRREYAENVLHRMLTRPDLKRPE